MPAIGAALCQSTIQGKMFRIFYIFHNPRPNQKVRKICISMIHYSMLISACFCLSYWVTMDTVNLLPPQYTQKIKDLHIAAYVVMMTAFCLMVNVVFWGVPFLRRTSHLGSNGVQPQNITVRTSLLLTHKCDYLKICY